MKLSLEDRVVLITGPAKGMGASITHAFAGEGCKLALMGRDTAAIAPVADEVKAGGGKAIVIPCDLTDSKQCEAAVETTKAAFGGRIDVLVNVAGGSGPIGKTGVQTTPEEFDEIVTLNMNGCFHTMRASLPTMIAQRYGKIVNVGGTFGMRGRAGRVAYSASKWGLRGITKSFALEVGPIQHQRQLRRTRNGRRSALSRQGLPRHGAEARHHRGRSRRTSRRRLRHEARHGRRRCRQRLSVFCQRRIAPGHRRRPAGRWRLGDVVSTP